MRFILLILFAFIFVSWVNNTFAQASGFPVTNGIEFSPRLIDNLLFLNNVGEESLSPENQMLYKWAETGIAREPNAGFSFLARYPHFQEYCKKYNVLRLGGPMLGNISEEGADVWIRTSKPARVKVVVDVDGQKKTFGPVQSTLES